MIEESSNYNILGLLNQIETAKSNIEIDHYFSAIRQYCNKSTELKAFCDILTTQEKFQTKFMLVITLQKLADSYIERYHQCKSKLDLNPDFIVDFEAIKRHINSFISIIERIFEVKGVPYQIKQKCVKIDFKLRTKEKSEYDIPKMLSKMSYFFKKKQFIIAYAFFDHIHSHLFLTKTLNTLFANTAQFLPESAKQELENVLNGKGLSQNENAGSITCFDALWSQTHKIIKESPESNLLALLESHFLNQNFYFILENIVFLESFPDQIQPQIINPFVKFQRLNYKETLASWKQKTFQIMVQIISSLHLSENLKKQEFQPLIGLILAIGEKYYLNKYCKLSSLSPQTVESHLSYVVPLFTALIKAQIFNISTHFFENGNLTVDCKAKFVVLTLKKLYLISLLRIENASDFEKFDEKDSLFDAFAFERCDNTIEENLIQMIECLCKKQQRFTFFLKNIILSLLRIDSELCEEEQRVITLLPQLEGRPSYQIQMGMVLAISFSKFLTKSDDFVVSVSNFFSSFTGQESVSIESAIYLGEFFRIYMDEVQIIDMESSHLKFTELFISYLNVLKQGECPNQKKVLHKVSLDIVISYLRLVKIASDHRLPNDCIVELILPIEEAIPLQYRSIINKQLIKNGMWLSSKETEECGMHRMKEYLNEVVWGVTGNRKWHGHQIFEVFIEVVKKKEYHGIFGEIFSWVYGIICQEKQQYSEECLNFCSLLLKQGHLVFSFDTTILQTFLKICQLLMTQVASTPPSQSESFETQNLFELQIQFLFLISTHTRLSSLAQLTLQKCGDLLMNITLNLIQIPPTMLESWQHPNHERELVLLMAVIELVYNNFEHLSEKNMEDLVDLFLKHLEFYNCHENCHGFVTGKYKIIMVILMRYRFADFNLVINKLPQEVGNRIYASLFTHEEHYMVKYEGPIYIAMALNIASQMWRNKEWVQQTYLPKYVQFLFGGCIFVLDRILENNRFEEEEKFVIPALEEKIKCEYIHLHNSTDRVHEKYRSLSTIKVDEFSAMKKFISLLKQDQACMQWYETIVENYVDGLLFDQSIETLINHNKIVNSQDHSVKYRKFYQIIKR